MPGIDDLYKRFKENIQQNHLINTDDKILVCVSGGIDSVALFHLFDKMKNDMNLTLGIAHINYKLRDEESEKDQKLVEKLSKQLKIPIYIKEISINTKKNLNEGSLQEKARKIRYDFFEQICKKHGFNKIAIAHNANDNAETVMLNLFRGSGISGLRGILITRDKIIRPLLFATRTEIMKFVSDNNIKYRHDQSNFTDKYNRNLIRLKVLPIIEKRINPRTIQNINHFSSIFSKFEMFLDAYTQEIISKIVIKKGENQFYLEIKKFNSYIIFIKENIILRSVYSLTNVHLDAKKVISILDLINSQVGKKVQINRNLSIWREREYLIFKLQEVTDKNCSLKINDTKIYRNYIISIKEVDKNSISFCSDKNIEYIDGSLIKGKSIIRNWKKADFYFPFGMKGKKKLSDFFTDCKVPSSEKDEIPILENAGRIVWICGYRLDNRFKCTEKSTNILKLEIKRRENIEEANDQ